MKMEEADESKVKKKRCKSFGHHCSKARMAWKIRSCMGGYLPDEFNPLVYLYWTSCLFFFFHIQLYLGPLLTFKHFCSFFCLSFSLCGYSTCLKSSQSQFLTLFSSFSWEKSRGLWVYICRFLCGRIYM